LAILSRPDSVSDTRQAPFEGSFRVTALHPRPKAARFYGEFDKLVTVKALCVTSTKPCSRIMTTATKT
jgi:hypothetical protein